MKKHIVIAAIVSMTLSFSVSAATEKERLVSALQGDYQAQRNLAFSYKNGWSKDGAVDFIPKNSIRSCAWRKIILMTNSQKVDDSDYANESLDCAAVHSTENQEVWKYVYIAVKVMSGK